MPHGFTTCSKLACLSPHRSIYMGFYIVIRHLYLCPLIMMILYFVNRIAELVEKETEAWYKMDPDPFDDRHPSEHL